MKVGIVMELQREALEDNISIESLMRKAYLVARKLNLEEFEEWINQEQMQRGMPSPGGLPEGLV